MQPILPSGVNPSAVGSSPGLGGLSEPGGGAGLAPVGISNTPGSEHPSVAEPIPTSVTQATSLLPSMAASVPDHGGLPEPGGGAGLGPLGIPNTPGGLRPSPAALPILTSITQVTSLLPSMAASVPGHGGLPEPGGGAGLAPVGIPNTPGGLRPSPVALPIPTSITQATSLLPSMAASVPDHGGLPEPGGGAGLAPLGIPNTPGGLRPSPAALPILTSIIQVTSLLPSMAASVPGHGGLPEPGGGAGLAPVGIPNTPGGLRPSPVALPIPTSITQVTSPLPPMASTGLGGLPEPGGGAGLAPVGVPNTSDGVRSSPFVLPIPPSITQATPLLPTLPTATPGPGLGGLPASGGGVGLAPVGLPNTPGGVDASPVAIPNPPSITQATPFLPTLATLAPGPGLGGLPEPSGGARPSGIELSGMTTQTPAVIITPAWATVSPSPGVLPIPTPLGVNPAPGGQPVLLPATLTPSPHGFPAPLGIPPTLSGLPLPVMTTPTGVLPVPSMHIPPFFLTPTPIGQPLTAVVTPDLSGVTPTSVDVESRPSSINLPPAATAKEPQPSCKCLS